jgi:hypothetical protein
VEAASWQLARSDGKNQLPYQHDSDRYGGSPTRGALVFVGDAMEDLPTFTPASLACQYFCFGKGTTPGATPTFHEIARLTGAPIAGSIQAQPGSWRSCGRVVRPSEPWPTSVAGCTGALDPPPTPAVAIRKSARLRFRCSGVPYSAASVS